MQNYTDEELNNILELEGFKGDVDNFQEIEICDIDKIWELEGELYVG